MDAREPAFGTIFAGTMMAKPAGNADRAIGRGPEQLSLRERLELAGKFIALEVYTPEALPLRRIEAIGDSIEECARMLGSRGLDPRKFEFVRLPAPY
jgi:hypothetical protein